MQHNDIQACISCPEFWCWNKDADKGEARCSKQRYFGLEKQLLSHKVKCLIYRALIRPVLTHSSETWAMGKHGENLLWSLDRKVLQKIFGPVHEYGHWMRHKISEIYTLNDEYGVGKFIKFGRLDGLDMWWGLQESDPANSLLYQTRTKWRQKGRKTIVEVVQWVRGGHRTVWAQKFQN